MYRILKIGMDVHSTNYTLCAMEPVIGEEDRTFATIKVTPDYKNILMFIENLKLKLGLDNQYDIQCGYEAGCLGYSLYNQLTAAGMKCVILAPTTMLTQQGTRIKTDARDARMIAQCLSYGGYHAVYIPTEEDAAVKEYLRMRDDHKLALKKVKQQINAFCLRHGCYYEGTKWTVAHLKWLQKLDLKELYRETLEEYMASYEEQAAKIERFDKRIEEIAAQETEMREIKYIKQPTEYLCGQACVAMIANVPIDDVIQVMHNDKGTGKKDIAKALEHYGITQAKTMTKADNSTPLPSVCILKVLLPKYSHWILYYYGKYCDPEFGLLDELYGRARIQSYLELFIDKL